LGYKFPGKHRKNDKTRAKIGVRMKIIKVNNCGECPKCFNCNLMSDTWISSEEKSQHYLEFQDKTIGDPAKMIHPDCSLEDAECEFKSLKVVDGKLYGIRNVGKFEEVVNFSQIEPSHIRGLVDHGKKEIIKEAKRQFE
jgi:hypothetical protein